MSTLNPTSCAGAAAPSLAVSLAAAALLSACAGPPTQAPPRVQPTAAAMAPAQFDLAGAVPSLLATPHQGSLTQLSQWWAAFDDGLLNRFIAQAQTASPQLAGALAKVEAARAAQAAARQALRPSFTAVAGASRGDSGQGAASQANAGLQAGWEIDLWGANRAGLRSADAQLSVARTDWHDARVLVAAETASTYFAFQHCERHVRLARADQASREATLKVNTTLESAGMLAPAQTALARASVAEGENRLISREAACNQLADALVALTGDATAKAALRAAAAAAPAPAPSTEAPMPIPRLQISQVPAEVLRQRPDVLRAELALAQAAASIVQAQASSKPRLSLSGSIGAFGVRAGGGSNDGLTWSFGPLQLSLPVGDGPVHALRESAAQAAYAAQLSALQASVRGAVRETQSALNDQAQSARRLELSQRAARDYRAVLSATTARHRAGLATTLELEETRRLTNLAESALLDAQADQLNAHISLYRAAGGGFDAALLPQTPVFIPSAQTKP